MSADSRTCPATLAACHRTSPPSADSGEHDADSRASADTQNLDGFGTMQDGDLTRMIPDAAEPDAQADRPATDHDDNGQSHEEENHADRWHLSRVGTPDADDEHGSPDTARLATNPTHEALRHARDPGESGAMQGEAPARATADVAASDTHTDHPAQDDDNPTREEEDLADHWHLARAHLLGAEGHSDQDATRIATDSLLEAIRDSHVPGTSARRVLARTPVASGILGPAG